MTNVHLTQAGNPYQKTSAGKKTGAAAFGLGAMSLACSSGVRKAASDIYVKAAEKYVSNGGTNAAKFMQIAKKFKWGGLAALTLIGTGLGTAVGAIFDKIVNNHRQVKADKAN